MKKILYSLIGFLIFLSSCVDLDVHDKSLVGSPWNAKDAATMYMNSLYNSVLPAYGFGVNANNCDESDGGNNLVQGLISSDDDLPNEFSLDNYGTIRYINLGIEDCLSGSLPESEKKEFLGQLYFLRAYMYYRMVLVNGGVSLVLDAQQLGAGDYNVPRSTAKVCFEQILKDLDMAVGMAPISFDQANRGRVTSAAAAALRGRVYLTFASDMFNPQNDQERWKDAYEANKEAKAICRAAGRELYPDFGRLFLDESTSSNTEIIWVVPYDYSGLKTHGWENSIRPGSMSTRSGRPGTNPTWSVCEAFPMVDGKPINESSEYSYSMDYFWKNRDPRFYATIAYNGSIWPLNGISNRRQWIYQGLKDDAKVATANLGVYCRKASNPQLVSTNTAGESTADSGTDWIEIRYAEVLMNLAECANEAGYSSEAYAELYAIRKRAGILAGTNGSYGITTGLNKEALREFIMKERSIEFAFENKRYWDMRRRLMQTNDLGTTPSFNSMRYRYTIVVDPIRIGTETAAQAAARIDAMRDNIIIDTESSNYFKITLKQRDTQFPLNFKKNYYFFAIRNNYLMRSPAVEQTIGWIDGRTSAGAIGTFDPLSDQGGTPWKSELN